MISKSYREVPSVTASLLSSSNNNSSATSSTSKFPLKTRYQAIDIGSGVVFDDRQQPSTKSVEQQPGSPKQRVVEKREIKSIGDILLTKTLGSGSTGKVKLGVNQKTGQKLAVKIVYRSSALPTNGTQQQRKSKEAPETRERRIMREASLLNLLRHPNIVQLYDMLITDDFYCLFFEYVEGGQMLDYIISHGKLKEKPARHFFRQLLSAVDYCHRNSIVHRDLKIENVLIDREGNVKLIDFGLSNFFNPKDSLKTFCGSLYFAAPELLKGNVYVGPEVDVWSLGVIFYVLVCGRVPFDDKSLPVLHEKIKKCSFEIPTDLSTECRHLLSRMIVGDPSQRASLAEVMHHPWTLGPISTDSASSSPIGGEIANFLPVRTPLSYIDQGIVENICLDFGIDLSYAMTTLRCAIEDWHSYCRHEIVSLYFLMMEKIQQEAVPATFHVNDEAHLPLPQPTTGRQRSMSITMQPKNQDTNITGDGSKFPIPRRHSLPENEQRLPMNFEFLNSLKLKSVYLKGIFSVNTTTLKTPSILAQEIARVLSLNSIRYSFIETSFLCQYVPSVDFTHTNKNPPPTSTDPTTHVIQFEIQLVKVAILGLLGIQFHRIYGDFKQYKNLSSHILTELRM